MIAFKVNRKTQISTDSETWSETGVKLSETGSETALKMLCLKWWEQEAASGKRILSRPAATRL